MDSEEKPIKRVGPKWLDSGNNVKVKQSKKQEFRIAKELNGRREPRSGANKWSQFDSKTAGRDIESKEAMIEHKMTNKESISLKKEWLDRINLTAMAAMKEPLLVITFQETNKNIDYAVIPLDTYKRLISNKD